MPLSDIADHLYGLAPEEFTKARDAAAKQARKDGDPELAAEVKQLRRPPVSAWAVNALARQRSGPLDELLALGAGLREAQQSLAGDDLRALSRQRHRVIASLTDEARTVLADAGQKLADATAREVSATLEAGLTDEAAAAAVRSGRLMRPLTSTGLEPVELLGAVAAPDDLAAVPKASKAQRAKPVQRPEDRRARRAEARTQARAARSDAARAERELATADRAVASAQDAASDAEARVAELAQALKDAKADHAAADSERRRSEQARDAATKAHVASVRAAEKAEAALARLT